MGAEARLKEKNITLPTPPTPLANYVGSVRVGNLLFLSGHGPLREGKATARGKLGKDLSVEQGYQVARQVGLNLLATTRATLGSRGTRRWRLVLNGLVFGGLSVVLMIARIQLAEGVYIDARSVPVALIGLFEGWQAGLLASALPGLYRLAKLGGAGAPAGAASVIVAGPLGGLVHAWARGEGRVRAHHALALSGVVFLATFASFVAVGPYAIRLFGLVWLPLLVTYVVGIGLVAQLFQDVVEQARLSVEQQRFRATIDDASEAIRIVDLDAFKIIDVNRRECELSGYRREEMIGRDVREFWPTEPELRARREVSV